MPTKPRYFEIAEAEIGVSEIQGPKSNKRIDEYLSTVGLSNDATPWCAAFVNWCLEQGGEKGTGAANARSYEKWGMSVLLDAAIPGDIVVLERGNSSWQGHVAFFDGWDGELVRLVGGNQANMVTRSRFARSRIIAIRRPKKVSDSTTVAAGTGAAAAIAAEKTIGAFETVTTVNEQAQQLIPMIDNDTLKLVFGVIALGCTLYMIYDRIRRLRSTGT